MDNLNTEVYIRHDTEDRIFLVQASKYPAFLSASPGKATMYAELIIDKFQISPETRVRKMRF